MPQELTNAAWSFTTANQSEGQLFAMLASASVRRIDDFKSQALVNLVWAFATSDQASAARHWLDAPLVFSVVARVAELHVRDFKLQELASGAWAFAKVSRSEVLLFVALAR